VLQGQEILEWKRVWRNARLFPYTGHFWRHGWSSLDVSDPKNPKCRTIHRGAKNNSTFQVTLFGDTMLTALEKILPGFGGHENAPFEEGVLIWDISDPLNPRKLSYWKTGGTGTHRNLYAGGRYAHLGACAHSKWARGVGPVTVALTLKPPRRAATLGAQPAMHHLGAIGLVGKQHARLLREHAGNRDT
jgi:hypothetical protein